MKFAHVKAVLALPFNVLVVLPALLLHYSDTWSLSRPTDLAFWAALLCFAAGLTLMATTIHLFAAHGRGTLAPWNPTQKLVIAGPYRYVRNPMISGVLFNLLGEALLFQARPIAIWFAAFFVGNAIYFPAWEEPDLEERFGDDYRRYKAAVPRWIPQLRPYQGS